MVIIGRNNGLNKHKNDSSAQLDPPDLSAGGFGNHGGKINLLG
jgi:hypothetical protein